MANAPLKLLARDAEDLAVLSACLQDAVVRVGAMAFVPEERRFVAVLDRFMWEGWGPERARKPLRMIRSGIRIERVKATRTRGIERGDPARPLELLALVEGAPEAGEGRTVTLLFAGGGEIRLEVEDLVLGLEDLGEPFDAPLEPRHALD